MPTVISRTWYNTLVDDSGGGTDGSIWDKADCNEILNAIDAMVAANIAFGGTVTAVGAFTGDGLVFPATQVASAGANTLDDYEEGTFTPTGSGVTLTVTAARYTKVGRLVTVEIDVTWPSTADATQARINSLPFTAAISSTGAIGYNSGSTAAIPLIQGTSMYLYAPTAGTVVTNANMTGAIVRVSGSYSV